MRAKNLTVHINMHRCRRAIISLVQLGPSLGFLFASITLDLYCIELCEESVDIQDTTEYYVTVAIRNQIFIISFDQM